MSEYPALVDFSIEPNNVSLVPVNYAEGLYLEFRWFDLHNITPIYELGFGLSYTMFELNNMKVEAPSSSLPTFTAPPDQALYDVVMSIKIY